MGELSGNLPGKPETQEDRKGERGRKNSTTNHSNCTNGGGVFHTVEGNLPKRGKLLNISSIAWKILRLVRPPVAALAERGGAGGKITKTTPNDKTLQFTGPLFARNVTTRLRVGAVLGGAYITALVRRSLGEGGSGHLIPSRSKACHAEDM